MSGEKVLWPAGLGVTEVDLQRTANAAADADDRVLGVIAPPDDVVAATYIKRVWPLHDDLRDLGDSRRFSNPRLLVTDAGNLGGTSGKVRLLPSAFEVAAPAALAQDGQQIVLTATQRTLLDSDLIASSPAGRVDVVYAVVTRTVPASDGTRDRRVKNPSTSVVTTQAVPVYNAPAVTLAIATGTEGSGTPATVPADGPGSYNVPLCKVTITAGYVSGGPLSSGGVEFITQLWERGLVKNRAMGLARPAKFMDFLANADAGLGDLTVINSQRYSDRQVVRAVLRHTGAMARVVVDAGIDWRLRLVRIAVLRTASQTPIAPFGNFPPPQLLASQGGKSNSFDSGWTWTGGVADVSVDATAFWEEAGPPNIRFFANSVTGGGIDAGALVMEIDDAPDDGGHGGDHYVVIAEHLARDFE